MTAITKKQRAHIDQAMNNMLGKLLARDHILTEDLFSLYWTPEERVKVKEVEKICKLTEKGFSEVLPAFHFTMPDHLPMPTNQRDVTLRFRVLNNSHYGMAPQMSALSRHFAPAEACIQLEQCMINAATVGYERWLWNRVRAMYDNATSHEEMRYLFPGTVYILRRAGLQEIASKVEEVNRRPATIQPLSVFERNILKYMNTWFATHIMLETFDKHTEFPGAEYTSVFLYGDQIVYVGGDDGDGRCDQITFDC